MRIIAVSDIHGCTGSFDALLDKIALGTSDELYLLGDLIDRGPGSKEVLDRVLHLQSSGYQVRCLRGNHEQMLLDARNNWDDYFDWVKSWGGRQTMESFKAVVPGDIPQNYCDFISEFEYFAIAGEYILVHAGLDFYSDNPLNPDENMLYLRNWYRHIDYDWLNGRIIVHGHTPIGKPEIMDMLRNIENLPVIDIDNGCFVNHVPGKGNLCAFDLTNRELFFQENIDDVSGYWSQR